MEKETFYITIEEHYTQTFRVQAEDIGEAMDIAEHKYQSGELVVHTGQEPQATLMMAEDESGEDSTEWVEI